MKTPVPTLEEIKQMIFSVADTRTNHTNGRFGGKARNHADDEISRDRFY